MAQNVEIISDRRRQTRSRVFRYLYNTGEPCSKQEIASAMNISLPTVYQNITELTDMGLVEEAGLQQSRGGRPAMRLRVAADAHISIGVGITKNRLRFSAVDLLCHERSYKKVIHHYDITSPEYSSFIADELERFINDNSIDRGRLLGVGISLPGIIDSEKEVISYAPTLNLKNTPFERLTGDISYPVYIDNDANAGGFAESFGEARGSTIAYLSLSDGVGGSVLINGDQFTGSNQRAGEFGHTCVEWNGIECDCGRRGCLEAYCTSTRLSDDLGITLDEFFTRLNAGDPETTGLWADFIHHLAIGILNIRMSLDCDIVLGGFLAEYFEPYIPQLREALAQSVPFNEDCSYLRLGRYPGHASVLGSAFHFVREFLESDI